MASLILQHASRPHGCTMNTLQVNGINKFKQKDCIKIEEIRNNVDGDNIGYNVQL